MSNKNDWIDQIKDKLDRYETPPRTSAEDEEMWGAILTGVRAEKQGRSRLLWVLLPAVGVAAALLLTWLLYRPQEPVPVFSEADPLVAAVSEADPITSPPVEEPIPSPTMQKTLHQLHYAEAKPLKSLLHTVVVETPKVSTATLVRTDQKRPKSSLTRPQRPIPELPSLPTRRHSSRMRTSLLAANLQGSGRSMEGYGGLYAIAPNKDYLAEGEVSGDVYEQSAQEMISFYNQAQETAISVRRHPPIRVGLMAAYEMLPGLYLESGLLYTREVTDQRQGSDSYYTDMRYTDHLLGVSLTLRYDFLDRGRWSLHASGTIMGEKCLVAGVQTNYHMDKEWVPSKSTSQSLPGDPIRWSVRGAMGVRYALTKQMGLFLEPGVTKQLTTLGRPYEEISPQTLFADGVIGLSFDF